MLIPYSISEDGSRANPASTVKRVDPDGVILIKKDTEYCPSCHCWIPTRDQQLVRRQDVTCQHCGHCLRPKKYARV